MENHFTESGEDTFSALSLLVHFIEPLHRISRESFHSQKPVWQPESDSLRESAPWSAPKRTLTTCDSLIEWANR
jgi:hypothetical protein